MMNRLFKKLLGIDKIEEQVSAETQKKLAEIESQIIEANRTRLEAEKEAEKSRNEAAQAKLTSKELATEKKESWVGVLETHVNKENVRNGFFELDWNEYFVLELRAAGYNGNSDEDIVDQWFSELCQNVAAKSGIDMSQRGSGNVNNALRNDGNSEIY